jgi:hypothetical protein
MAKRATSGVRHRTWLAGAWLVDSPAAPSLATPAGHPLFGHGRCLTPAVSDHDGPKPCGDAQTACAVSSTGKRASASRQAAAKSAVPTSPVQSE